MRKTKRQDEEIPFRRLFITSILVVFLTFLFSNIVEITQYLGILEDIEDVYMQKFSELTGVVIVTIIVWISISL